MNKSELVAKLAKKTGLTQAKAAEAVDAIFNPAKGILVGELTSGKKVTLPGFGSFFVRKRAARKGRNPATGKEIHIPARKYPAFKVGKTLKEKVSK
ncbi:MAG: HU family DNA-binding protein [Thermoanaerobaculum sp.]|nr:HU family DNA-binding protein [Thermoanaerobaculum sp.]MDW7967289.1 HU family DNA-binding protein [Thermoanaerobaculum sp.]